MKTLRHTGGMHYVVKLQIAHLFHQVLLRGEVDFQEMDAFVCEPLPRTALAEGHPYVHVAPEGFIHDETANKACGTSYQYVTHFDRKINHFLSKTRLLVLFKTSFGGLITFFPYI